MISDCIIYKKYVLFSPLQIQAADLDSGSNSKITYQLGAGDRLKHFQIDPSKGIITVASALDREMVREKCSFTLVNLASLCFIFYLRFSLNFLFKILPRSLSLVMFVGESRGKWDFSLWSSFTVCFCAFFFWENSIHLGLYWSFRQKNQ